MLDGTAQRYDREWTQVDSQLGEKQRQRDQESRRSYRVDAITRRNARLVLASALPPRGEPARGLLLQLPAGAEQK
jgi:hypothetical protein